MMNKKMIKKIAITYLEIFILITASFSFAYIIYENTTPLGEIVTKAEGINSSLQKKNLFKVLGLIILEKIKQPILPMVSSATGDFCCQRTNNNTWCQNTPQANCDVDYNTAPFACEDAGWCNRGCCYNPSKGICVSRTYEGSCTNGNWQEGSCGNILDCKEACCIYGGQSSWITETACEIDAANYPGRTWDTSIRNEIQCILLSDIQGTGACIKELDDEKRCEFVSEAECTGPEFEFYENNLCTNPELNTTCLPSEKTTCVEEQQGVYFQDSCGNTANIYDSSKLNDIEYWKTKITKDDSCNYGDLTGNADSKTCGNCRYIDGSTCGLAESISPTYGENICKDLSCEVEIDGQTVTKQNSESWCVFDGAIGVGEVSNIKIARDTVGSRYWKHACSDGEEIVEPCSDFRQEVCSETINNQTGKSYAKCRLNRWRDCVNREIDVCEDNSDCWKKNIKFGDDFEFDVCLPKYPGGFDILETDKDKNGQTICNSATLTCPVTYVRSWALDSCKCVSNCDCKEPVFAQKMNSFCASLGDCGGYVNVDGKYTDEGYKILKDGSSIPKRLPANDITKMLTFANPLLFPNQVVERGKFISSPYYYDGTDRELGGSVSPGWNLNIVSFVAIAGAIVGITIWWGPVGWIIGGVLIGLAYFLGVGKVCKDFKVEYTCGSWQPPLGGDDCDKCNGDDQKPCTPYRCKSLGKACELINEGTTIEECMASIDDGNPPIITPLFENVTDGLKYENIKTNGFEIKNLKSDDGCIESFTPINFSIKTSEHALCKYDLVRGTEFSKMPQNFGDTHLLLEKHTNTILLPSPESLADFFQVPTEHILENYGNMELFVSCQDYYGDINPIDYSIKFCVKKNDGTAPYVVTSDPLDISYLKYNETNTNVTLWINEPSDCRYTKIDDSINYDNMENNMSCQIFLANYTVRGWPCEFTLDNITADQSVFIRCKDKPWLPDWNESRNVRQTSDEYKFQVSDSELEVEEMRPEDGEQIILGIEPWLSELRLKTKGGAEEGKAICKWREDNQGWHSSFVETNAIYHKSSEFPFIEGNYYFNYTCEDIAGNIVEDSSSFEIIIDKTGPRIVRIYYENGLKVITNDKAECRYSFQKSTGWANSTKMTGLDFEHVANWQLKTYYIQCQDDFHNKGGKKRIKAYTLLD